MTRLPSDAPGRFMIFNADQSHDQQQGQLIDLSSKGYFVPNDWSSDGRAIVGQATVSEPSIDVYTVGDGALHRLANFGEWPV